MNNKICLIVGAILVIIIASVLYIIITGNQWRKEVSVTSSISITTEESLTQTNMKIASSAFENNAQIPSKYTCDAENINPPLEISEIPEGTVSLALLVDDPDAPAGDWVHWLVWNIPPSTESIAEGSAPQGVEGTTDFGKTEWGGPCPPSGTHRYFFKLYALDTELDLPETAKKVDLLNAMDGHVLEQVEIVGLYQRQ